MFKNISKLMCSIIFIKRYVCQHCVAFKTGNVSSFYVFLIQIIDGNLIFGHLSANVPPGPKLANVPPLNSGGPGSSIAAIR